MAPGSAPQLRYLVATTLALVACDSFDFGRVMGSASAPTPAAPAPSAGPIRGASSAEQAPAAPERDEIVVLIGGDVALGGNVKTWVSANKKYDPLVGLRPIFEGNDVAIASLVSPITDAPAAAPRAAVAVSPAAGADALARSGLRILDVGGESLWSSGKAGFVDTLSNLSRVGLVAAGASVDARADAASAPARVTTRGRSIALVATTRWPDKSPALAAARDHVAFSDEARLAALVRGAKRDGAIVIAGLGGAAEDAESPAPDLTVLARTAIDAGADVVFAHGAHVPLGVAWAGGHPIFYGLGNLIADDDPKNPWTGRGLVAKVTVARDGVRSVDLCPFLIADGEPKLLAGPSRPTEEGIFKRAIARLSGPLGALTISEPDLHSCMRVAPPPASAASSASAAPGPR